MIRPRVRITSIRPPQFQYILNCFFNLQQIKIAVGEEVVTRRARLQPRDKREAEPPAEEEFEEEYKDLEININTTER